MSIRPHRLIFTALLVALSSSACAQSAPASPTADAPVPASPPPTADADADTDTDAGTDAAQPFEATADPLLPRIDAAIAAAERGDFDAAQYGDLTDHPLYRWVEYASLRDGIDNLSPARAQAFLQRYQGDAVADLFREYWLAEAARREDWPAFLAAWRPAIDRTNLRCAWLSARVATGETGAQWTSDAQAIWLADGKALPHECLAPMTMLVARGGLNDALRWQRINLAAEAGNASVMRKAAEGLPAGERELANDYAAYIESPHPRALDWPKTERSRTIATLGLARLARQDPDAAEAQLPAIAQALEFSEADRGRVLYPIALWTVASYLPGSERRLAAVPAVSFDERLHEWQVREALARSDWPAALAAIRRMSDEQRSDSKYEYFQARLAELTGDPATAQRLYRSAAREAEFHGFLAADRIGAPYALCPWQVQATPAERAAIAGNPALMRAMRLYQLGRDRWAVQEWHDALDGFADGEAGQNEAVQKQERLAVALANAYGWYDRAIFTLGEDGQRHELQLYTLRFPLQHDAVIRREAADNGIDPAWVAAEIRAESVFNPRARSGAGAMGLMQVLPSTGAATARQLGLPWRGAASLYEPETNIVLGTDYLRKMLAENGGEPYFAIAAYNAGPSPLARWRRDRPGMAPDFWIETISYHETRDYVPRVLAFSVIYDWRLDGDALRVSERLHGNIDGERTSFACPAPVAVD